MIVADTSGLLALFNQREPAHDEVASYVAAQRDAVVLSPYVVAELDYLVATRFGVSAELTVLHELAGGAYDLVALDAADLDMCAEIVERYRDQAVGVADASLVVLAQRCATNRILTLDRRHFDVLRPLGGGRFSIVPR